MLFLRWMIKLFLGSSMLMSFMLACSPVKFNRTAGDCGGLGEGACTVRPTEPNYKDYNYTVGAADAPKVDILIVNDSSSSMKEDQVIMANNFGSFLAEISDLDWQIGITTMDISNAYRSSTEVDNENSYQLAGKSHFQNYQDGNLIPFSNGSKVLTKRTNNARALFNEGISIPSEYFSDGDERGIFAAALATTKANSPLFRSGAHSVFIFLSDEDVRSMGEQQTRQYYPITDQDRPEYLLAAVESRGMAKTASVYSIVVPSNPIVERDRCLNIQRNQSFGSKGAQVGKMYEDLLTYFKGGVGSICSSNYGQLLKDIGEDIEKRTKEVFTLACIPEVGSEFPFEIILPSGYTKSISGREVTVTPALKDGDSVSFIYSCRED